MLTLKQVNEISSQINYSIATSAMNASLDLGPTTLLILGSHSSGCSLSTKEDQVMDQVTLPSEVNIYLGPCLFALVGIIASLTLFLNRRISKNPEFLHLNCWFCNEDFPIPFRKANSWTCPSCEGYNGFSNDGNYNADINTSSQRYTRFAKPEEKPCPSLSHLCRNCELNQCLKVNQLSAFVPQNENNFDTEVEAYEAHLDRVYRLCRRCEATLHQKLGEQDSKIRPNLLSWKIESNRLARKHEGGLSPFLIPPRASLSKRIFAVLLSLCLVVSYEAGLITGILTVLQLLSYTSGGLLQLRRHRINLFLWVMTFSSGILKEYVLQQHQEEFKISRIVLGLLCSVFTILSWNLRLGAKKKSSSSPGKKNISSTFHHNRNPRKGYLEGEDWGLMTSTPAPSVMSSRASSVFSPKEEEEDHPEENSKYDISSLSIEDNVETEFTLMGAQEVSGKMGNAKGSPPFAIKQYTQAGSPINSGGVRQRRSLLRPATLSPPPPDSPSKGVAKASWVAGGYWHSKPSSLSVNERTVSRSSSQSSGFGSYDNGPNLRVIRNTFARSSLPPEPIHAPSFQRPRQMPPSSDRYSCDEFLISNNNNGLFRDSASSLASSGHPWNDSAHNTSLMDKEFNVRVSAYSLILGVSVFSNFLLMGYLAYSAFLRSAVASSS